MVPLARIDKNTYDSGPFFEYFCYFFIFLTVSFFLTVSCFDFILFCRIFQLKIQIGFEIVRSHLKLSDLVISLENLTCFLIIILGVFDVIIFHSGQDLLTL